VPAVYWRASSARVLTSGWIEGVKLSDGASLRGAGLDVLRLVDIGIQCSLRQLLEEGFFHADPHPGNLLATADGRLAFLDFGMMSETPRGARAAIIAHVVHLVNRDYEQMAQDYYRLGFLDRSVDVSPIVPALAAFFDDVLSATVSEINFKTITDGLGAILYAYPFDVPGYYALILRSLTVLEGLALSSDPEYKVLAAAYPFFASRLLTGDEPELRESLAELIFAAPPATGVRWGRLESLLAQAARPGARSAGAAVAGALPPLLNLVLGPQEGGPPTDPGQAALRTAAEAEAARCVEALALGGGAEGWAALRPLLPQLGGAAAALARASPSPAETAELLELRAQLLRVAALLRPPSTEGEAAADWAWLAQPRVALFARDVASRVAQRAVARGLQALLAPSRAEPATV